MRIASLAVALTLAALCGLVLTARAEEGKEVTLKGKLVCGKCTLKETDACSNVLQVEKDGKTINYFLKDDGKKAKYHKDICKPDSSKEASVTGVVSEKDGKQWLTVKKFKFN
jgi:hypothetical protein